MPISLLRFIECLHCPIKLLRTRNYRTAVASNEQLSQHTRESVYISWITVQGSTMVTMSEVLTTCGLLPRSGYQYLVWSTQRTIVREIKNKIQGQHHITLTATYFKNHSSWTRSKRSNLSCHQLCLKTSLYRRLVIRKQIGGDFHRQHESLSVSMTHTSCSR